MHPYLNIAVKAARAAGKIMIDAMLHSNAVWSANENQDLVATANIDGLMTRLNETISDAILRAYPQHIIATDLNYAEVGFSKDPTWLIDPLNGKINFVHGLPLFAISLAFKYNHNLEHAVIYNPLTDELFVASKGAGAKLNDKRIRVAKQHKMAEALLAVDKLEELTWQPKNNYLNRILGSSALQLAFVAAGRLDGYCGLDVTICEMAAGVLLVREAGGYVTDIDLFNNKTEYSTNKILAANIKIYQQLDLLA